MHRLSAFVCGAMFALGLGISGMIKPSKVIGFLDFLGEWDPTLAFVMGGALAVFLPVYRVVSHRERPVLTSAFDLPARRDIDWQLLAGAGVFGVGWAVTGFCPAAAIAALPAMSLNAIVVTAGMALGIVGMRWLRAAVAPAAPETVADF